MAMRVAEFEFSELQGDDDFYHPNEESFYEAKLAGLLRSAGFIVTVSDHHPIDYGEYPPNIIF